MRRFALALALLAVCALALGACASGKDTGLPFGPTSPPVSKTCTEIDMVDALKFVPDNCTAKVGDTVTWKNTGGAPHTVTEENPKIFDSGGSTPIAGGQTFTFKFTKAGTYPYFCRLHTTQGSRQGMVGTIVVQA